MSPKVKIDRDGLTQFCLRWGIAELALFGSALRQDFSDASDIDLLVTFKSQSDPALFDFVRMHQELSRLRPPGRLGQPARPGT